MRLPSGVVTLMFTDIEGSTRLWEEDPSSMAAALAEHDRLLRESIENARGIVFKTVGDAFCSAFELPADGLRAALSAQRALAKAAWPSGLVIRVRMALHTGVCVERDGDYFGRPVNRVARLEAVAHGGQIVLSRAAATLAEGGMPAGVELRDLGFHRLKDLENPEHVYQVVTSDLPSMFPPLRSLDELTRRHNLPLQLSSFVGRSREMNDVRALVASSRLVTLVGTGGSGKTRLAEQLAAELVDEFPDGVWIVYLAPFTELDQVIGELARIFDVVGSGDLFERVLTNLRHRHLLFVIDNCEHLVGPIAELVSALMRSTLAVHVVATSRERLRLAGEVVYRVPSLSLPDVDRADCDAVRLFLERAAEQDSDFWVDDDELRTIEAVCARLDGMPLAIELAASRAGSMSVREIAARLDDRFTLLTAGARSSFPRQQTLRALIDWSYELLSDSEKTMFVSLSVFRGGWTHDAMEHVVTAMHPDLVDVTGLHSSLVDKSMVQVERTLTGVRYAFLETIGAYARERCGERNPATMAELPNHHLAYFVEFADERHAARYGDNNAQTGAEIYADFVNLRAALDHAVAMGAAVDGLHLTRSLGWHVNRNDRHLLAATEKILSWGRGPLDLRAKAHIECAFRLEYRSREQRRHHLNETLRLSELAGDSWLAAEACVNLVSVDVADGAGWKSAHAYASRAVVEADRSNDPVMISAALVARATCCLATGLPEQADLDLIRAESITSQRNAFGMAEVLSARGSFHLATGQLEEAERCYRSALAVLASSTGRAVWNGWPSIHLGLSLAVAGKHSESASALSGALQASIAFEEYTQAASAAIGLSYLANSLRSWETAGSLLGVTDMLMQVALCDELEPPFFGMRNRLASDVTTEIGDERFTVAHAIGFACSVVEASAFVHRLAENLPLDESGT